MPSNSNQFSSGQTIDLTPNSDSADNNNAAPSAPIQQAQAQPVGAYGPPVPPPPPPPPAPQPQPEPHPQPPSHYVAPNFISSGNVEPPRYPAGASMIAPSNYDAAPSYHNNDYALPPPPPPPNHYQPIPVPAPAPPPAPAPAYPVHYPAPVHIPAPVVPVPVPGPIIPNAIAVPAGPFPIHQPTITNTGETIIETLVGGIPFDCRGRPSGHWRDGRYCDIFHACVFGMQRKTYSCPFVGERTYFDEISRRCEFVNRNPLGCAGTVFYH